MGAPQAAALGLALLSILGVAAWVGGCSLVALTLAASAPLALLWQFARREINAPQPQQSQGLDTDGATWLWMAGH